MKLNWSHFLCAIVTAMLVGQPTALRAEPVAVSLAPFVWVPSLRGQLSEGPVTIPLNASARDLVGGLKGGGMLHAEADTRRFHASLQAIYFDFHDRSFAPVLGADVRSNLLTIEALAGPRLKAGKVELVPMAGLRHTRINGTIDAPGLGTLKAGRTWQEALAGLEVKVPFSNRLMLRARGTVAVAGPSGQDGSDMIVAMSYRMGRSVSLAAGYRWASDRIDPGGVNAFGMNLKASGPVLGLQFRL